MTSMSDKKFVCVFTEDAKELLQSAGMVMITEDERNGIYEFLNEAEQTSKQKFALSSVSFILSDTLTFT